MRKEYGMTCIATMKNMTSAKKASRVLKSAGIPSVIVNPDPRLTAKGCSWGVEFSSVYLEKVLALLKRARVTYGEIIG